MVNNTNYNTTDGWWLVKKDWGERKKANLRLGVVMVFHKTVVIVNK
jgi:hypothetical protein